MGKDNSAFHIQRLLNKVAAKFPATEQPEVFTDIHIRVSQDTADVGAFDDEDKEITRVVVDEWIESPLETEEFYNMAFKTIRNVIDKGRYDLGIMRPYNYVLENELGEHIAEVYVVDDDDTTILGAPFMENLDADLDNFINNLLKD
mgnify:CR=1 FL=1